MTDYVQEAIEWEQKAFETGEPEDAMVVMKRAEIYLLIAIVERLDKLLSRMEAEARWREVL